MLIVFVIKDTSLTKISVIIMCHKLDSDQSEIPLISKSFNCFDHNINKFLITSLRNVQLLWLLIVYS